jgi:hypothetical protein
MLLVLLMQVWQQVPVLMRALVQQPQLVRVQLMLVPPLA